MANQSEINQGEREQDEKCQPDCQERDEMPVEGLGEKDGAEDEVPDETLDSGGDGKATEQPASPSEDGSLAKKPVNGRMPSWVKPIVVVLLVILAAAIGLFAWRESRFAEVPDVIGDSPAESTSEIEAISDKWEVAYAAGDDLSGLSDEDIDARYEVVGVDPAVGERLSKDESNTITITLEKNAATRAAERLAIIQGEISGSLENGYADETYVDNGDVVVFKAVHAVPVFVDGTYRVSPSVGKDQQPEIYATWEDSQDGYKQLAESLQSNVVSLIYGSDGYLMGIFVGLYSDTTDGAIERAAQIAAEARDAHIAKVTDNLSVVLDGFVGVYSGFDGCEYVVENGQVTFYVYGNGMIASNGENISNSSARIEQELRSDASSFAYYLQTPVTIKFIKNGALFATATSEPESMVFTPAE
ncbi:hypothetical protein B5F89_07780 [Collinsella sp. An307]|nr:hypothetical protein B5F89_07780 [Collinsella sp. An307]